MVTGDDNARLLMSPASKGHVVGPVLCHWFSSSLTSPLPWAALTVQSCCSPRQTPSSVAPVQPAAWLPFQHLHVKLNRTKDIRESWLLFWIEINDLLLQNVCELYEWECLKDPSSSDISCMAENISYCTKLNASAILSGYCREKEVCNRKKKSNEVWWGGRLQTDRRAETHCCQQTH